MIWRLAGTVVLAATLALPASATLAQQGDVSVQPLPNPVTGAPGVVGGITPGSGSQGAGAVQGTGGVQGGFVTDSTGLGHVGASSVPPPSVAPGPEKVTGATGAVVRWLDKVSGQTVDITLSNGQAKTQGRLTVQLGQCRYPVDDPSSNAYAYLIIRDSRVQAPIFKGWMIASSPALNPLDNPRYDVWLLRCTTS